MKVLVVGGGVAGLTACTSIRKFDKHVEIVLVEPKEYMEVHWCSYRSVFDESVAANSLFNIGKWAVPKSIKHIREKVMDLKEDHAILSNRETVEFNICVIATGAIAKWSALGRGPPHSPQQGKISSRLKKLKEEGAKLLNADSVLIVGGGLIGVETAGDLASYAQKAGKSIKITLVHSGEDLIPEYTPRAATMVKNKLENLGVKVILNDKAIEHDDKWVLDSNGQELDASEVIKTTGIFSCAPQCIKSPQLKSKFLDKKGWIQVDDYFRVKGLEQKFFAIGDCCDLLPNAASQVVGNLATIGKNITVILDAIENDDVDLLQNDVELTKKMRKAIQSAEMYVTTIGNKVSLVLCYVRVCGTWCSVVLGSFLLLLF